MSASIRKTIERIRYDAQTHYNMSLRLYKSRYAKKMVATFVYSKKFITKLEDVNLQKQIRTWMAIALNLWMFEDLMKNSATTHIYEMMSVFDLHSFNVHSQFKINAKLFIKHVYPIRGSLNMQ